MPRRECSLGLRKSLSFNGVDSFKIATGRRVGQVGGVEM